MILTDYGTSEQLYAKLLGCEVSELSCLDSIVLPVEDFYEISDKTFTGFCEEVYRQAKNYLVELYEFAAEKLKANPKAYDGSVLKWDADLLNESIDFLDPKNDLHWGTDTNDFYLELDYFDLYWSVIGTINEDFGSDYSIKEFDRSFTKELWGGKKTPEKFESLLL